MKISTVIATEGLFKNVNSIEEGFKLASKYGFDAVEPSIANPWQINPKDIRKLAEDLGLKISAISTGLGFAKYGWSLSSTNNELRKKAIEAIFKHIDNAVEMNAMVIIGLIRGIAKESIPEALKIFEESLARCVEYAESHDVTLLLEPINRYETNLINDINTALKIVEKIGSKKLRVLIDTFHMNIEEKSIEASIIKAQKYLGYVHIADSNRYAPGYGHLDFKNIILTLKEVGYDGFLSTEIITIPNTEIALHDSIKYLRLIIELCKKP